MHSTFGPQCCWHRWPGGHCPAGQAPQGPLRTRVCTHTHKAVCPPTRTRLGLAGGTRGHPVAAARWAGVRSHIDGGSARPPPATLHVREPPPLGGAGGSRSWANTESSPEELELGVSWPPGEYCSKGTDRSRYSCGRGRGGSVPLPPPPSPPGGGTSTHVGGRHREDAVQVLHQLLEGGPLGGRGVPALPHDHVPAGGTQVRPRPVPAPAPPQQRPGPRTHRSCVQLAGLSMRWPSFSSLKSSSTGMPGYGEPPSVKISHSRTPKDQLWGGPARQPALRPAAPEQTLPRAGGWLCPHGFPAPALEGPGPTPPSPRRAGGTYTSLWWV